MNNIQAYCVGSNVTCTILSVVNAIENKTASSFIALGVVAVLTVATVVLSLKGQRR